MDGLECKIDQATKYDLGARLARSGHRLQGGLLVRLQAERLRRLIISPPEDIDVCAKRTRRTASKESRQRNLGPEAAEALEFEDAV